MALQFVTSHTSTRWPSVYRSMRTKEKGALSARARVRLNSGETRRIGRLNVYRSALASWYGPGLFGNKLGCGGTLQAGSLGVANKSLPCGTKVTLMYRGRSATATVTDRGPYVGGRVWDLTPALKSKLGFGDVGTVWSTS